MTEADGAGAGVGVGVGLGVPATGPPEPVESEPPPPHALSMMAADKTDKVRMQVNWRLGFTTSLRLR
jgi:hypothetical protein